MVLSSSPSSSLSSASYQVMSVNIEAEYSSARGVKLLFSKSKVFMHPTKSAADNRSGFIALLQQKSSSLATLDSTSNYSNPDASKLLLAWVPENSLGDSLAIYAKVDLNHASSPPKETHLVSTLSVSNYAANPSIGAYAFATPVNNIYSLTVRPPVSGWYHGSVIINTRRGESFPALFFHDNECESTLLQRKKLTKESFDPFNGGVGMFWGGDEVLRWLKRYVRVERAGAEPNIYLIQPTDEDRRGFSLFDSEKSKKIADKHARSSSSDAIIEPLAKNFNDFKWNVLSKFTPVAAFARQTVKNVEKIISDNSPRQPNFKNLGSSPDINIFTKDYEVTKDYLAKWATYVADQSEKERRLRISSSKVDAAMSLESTGVSDFDILNMDQNALQARRSPVTLSEWNSFFDSQGYLNITVDEVEDKIFHGGLDAEDGVRKEAWPFLFGVYDWHQSSKDRQAIASSQNDKYICLKAKWWNTMIDGGGTQEQRDEFEKQKFGIEKDVHRTDRFIPFFAGEDMPHPDPESPFAEIGTNVHLEQMKDMLLTYNEHNTITSKEQNTVLGYVQGMSDLLAPIFAVLQDEAMAFWAYVKFMDRMQCNFSRDQIGMNLQLLNLDHLVLFMDPNLHLHLEKANATNFFCFYRMLLVWFKREFEWTDVLRLWEILWTNYYSDNFHIFIAFAILERNRDTIMENIFSMDEMLGYIISLSDNMNLELVLRDAEAIFLNFQQKVEAADRKHSFPAPRPALNTMRGHRRPSTSSLASFSSPAVDSGIAPTLLHDIRSPSTVAATVTTGSKTTPNSPMRPNSRNSRIPLQGNVKIKGQRPIETMAGEAKSRERRIGDSVMEAEISNELRNLLKRDCNTAMAMSKSQDK